MIPSADDPDAARPGFTVIAGNPTPAELAAVIAVIESTLDEQGESDRRRAQHGQSAWQRSQRPIRGTLRPGSGAWRGFSG